MANNIAFQPMGKTVKVAVSGAANTQSNVFTITSDSPSNQYLISNADINSGVYVWISSSSTFNVSLPDVSPSYVIPLPPYAYKVITGPQVGPNGNVYARVIGDAANASVYVTPGEGL
ncbi:hypothetical protein [Bacteriophage sp.]|nr:hypothetical protein [Bacteriophage sp.]